MTGRMPGLLESEHILVDKKSDVEFVRLVKTKLFELNGKARARVIADKVVINKGGWLEGTVYARSIVVDKGGIFTGDLNIGQDFKDIPDEPPIESDRNLARFEEDAL